MNVRQKSLPQFIHQSEPHNATLFGNGDFLDAVKIWSYYIRVDLNLMTGVFIVRGTVVQRKTQIQRKKMEAEIGVMQPQAKEYLGIPEMERAKEKSSQSFQRASGPTKTLILDFNL